MLKTVTWSDSDNGRLESSWQLPQSRPCTGSMLLTLRMCSDRKASCGAEVMVKGCHSKEDIAGHLMKQYMPLVKRKPRGLLQHTAGMHTTRLNAGSHKLACVCWGNMHRHRMAGSHKNEAVGPKQQRAPECQLQHFLWQQLGVHNFRLEPSIAHSARQTLKRIYQHRHSCRLRACAASGRTAHVSSHVPRGAYTQCGWLDTDIQTGI